MPLNKAIENFNQQIIRVQSGKKTLDTLVKPILRQTKDYSRITSFFTPTLIKSKIVELAQCFARGGKVKLIVGIHDTGKLIPVLNELNSPDKKSNFKEAVQKIIETGMIESIDLFDTHEDFIAVLAELIDQKYIQIKISALRSDFNYYLENNSWPLNGGIFHPKIGIFSDDDHTIVMSGSINSTLRGYGSNIEEANFIGSWFDNKSVVEYVDIFENLWNNTYSEAVTLDFTNEIKLVANKVRNSSALFRHVNLKLTNQYFSFEHYREYLKKSPLLYIQSFNNIRLLEHQKEVYKNTLSRYPIRALIADEVGLGKTIEAGSIIKYAREFLKVKKSAFLVPASLRYQWQDELYKHFDLKVYVYERSTRSLSFKGGYHNEVIHVGDMDNLYNNSVENIIFSWHLLRLDASWIKRLTEVDKVDFVTVDEAHWARMKSTPSGDIKPTKLFEFLSKLLMDVKHYLLLTATPFQTSQLDYKSMLIILMNTEDIDTSSLARISKLNRGDDLNSQESLDAVTELINNYDIYQTEPMNGLSSINDFSARINWFENDKYIKNSPTSIYTIRNTRNSLKKIGYKFPRVEFFSKSVDIDKKHKDLFSAINIYLEDCLCEFEKSLKKTNTGFIKTIYSQRMVSSLKACDDTLKKRKSNLETCINQGYYIVDEAVEEDFIENGESIDSSRIELTDSHIQKANREINFIEEINYLIETISKKDEHFGDPKIKQLLNIITKYIESSDKIIVFSKYTSTTAFITKILDKKKICNYGRFEGQYKQISIDNIIKDVSREEFSQEFKKGDFPLIICSDAASEGLNLQTANVLVNVDVPWNPAKLLQRFGRIDRFGQKSNTLTFYNLFYPNTIEDKMYSRLHERNDDFRELLGDTPEITSSDHLVYLEDNEFVENTQPREIMFRNSLLDFNQSSMPIHEILLEKISSVEHVSIDDNNIKILEDEYAYSTDFISDEYLDLHHPVLKRLFIRNSNVTHKLSKLINGNKDLLSYCIIEGDSVFPLLNQSQFLDYFFSGKQIQLDSESILLNKDSLSKDFLDMIKDTSNNLIYHNRITFNEDCDMYESISLELTSLGIDCKIVI
jgi:superfamily II DNA or RNA helicase